MGVGQCDERQRRSSGSERRKPARGSTAPPIWCSLKRSEPSIGRLGGPAHGAVRLVRLGAHLLNRRGGADQIRGVAQRTGGGQGMHDLLGIGGLGHALDAERNP